MTDQNTQHPDGSKHDTTEYSASKAPENQKEKKDDDPESDPRMLPGGRTGAPVGVGMSAMDREDVPSRAEKPAELKAGDSPEGVE